jgi:transmembrane sensor
MCAKRPVHRDEDRDDVADGAAQWLARRDRGLSSAEELELQGWAAADPRGAAELARLEAAWQEFDRAKSDPDLVAMAREVDRATALKARSRAPVWKGVLMAAAAIALAAGLAWRPIAGTADDARVTVASRYQLIPSTARLVALQDGSMAEVRGDGEIRATFTEVERRIELIRGEAHFTVQKDSSKPFIVQVGDTAVRAVGTAFNVRLEPERVEVLVTEGEVVVADLRQGATGTLEQSPSVVAGYRAVVGRANFAVIAGKPADVEITPTKPAELDRALAWRSARLIFDRTPLEDAVEAFNRHSSDTSGMRLVIGDARLSSRLMGGTFRATNVEGFVRLLEQSPEIRVDRRGRQIVLLPAH